jgi:aminocarboxymuconate-semialdehyde decarboxylase
MLNRRTFTRTGLAFVGCCLTGFAQTPSAGGRRQVTVGGRRVKTVDFHSHCAVPGVMELMGQTTPTNGVNGALLLANDRLKQMDAQGIDVEVLSINPFWYSVERDLARTMIKIQNEKLSEYCNGHSDRFVGLASIALQHPDLAAEELEEAIKKLGLRGAAIGGSVNGEELANPKFEPFWAKAEELAVPVFIHPQAVPEFRGRLQGSGILTNVIGNPLETTIALSHLIFEGTLDRFPNLKICAAHGGGYLPSYADRSDLGCITLSQNCKPLKKKPTEYLRQIYVDSMVFSSEGLRHLAAVCGSGRIVMGTDYPYPWTTTSVDHILNTPGFSNQEREAMLGTTAMQLLGMRS